MNGPGKVFLLGGVLGLAVGGAIWMTARDDGKQPSAFANSGVDKKSTPVASIVNPSGSSALPDSTPDASQLHPDEFAAFLDHLFSSGADWKIRRAGVLELCAKNPEAVARWAAGPLAGSDRAFVLRAALFRWTRDDANAALTWALTLTVEQGRDPALRAVFQAMAVTDPAGVAAMIMNVKDFSGRGLAVGLLVQYWAASDRDAAVRWAWALPEGPERTEALAALLHVLYREDAAFAGAARSPDTRALNLLGGLLVPEDPSKGTAWLRDALPGGGVKDLSFQTQLSAWVLQNPEEALVWAGLLGDDPLSRDLLEIVLAALGREYPADALRLAASMKDPLSRYRTVYDTVLNWYAVDPDGAAAYVAQIQNPDIAGPAQDALAEGESALPSQPTDEIVPTESPGNPEEPAEEPIEDSEEEGAVPDPAEFMQWSWAELVALAEQLPPGDLRNGIAHKAAVDWARDPAWPPAAPAAWVMGLLGSGRSLDNALRVILWDWARDDLESAAAWVLAESGYRRDHGLATIAMAAADRNPARATELAAMISDAEMLRSTVGNLAYRLGSIDEPGALAWANSLADPELRAYALSKIAAAVQAK